MECRKTKDQLYKLFERTTDGVGALNTRRQQQHTSIDLIRNNFQVFIQNNDRSSLSLFFFMSLFLFFLATFLSLFIPYQFTVFLFIFLRSLSLSLCFLFSFLFVFLSFSLMLHPQQPFPLGQQTKHTLEGVWVSWLVLPSREKLCE